MHNNKKTKKLFFYQLKNTKTLLLVIGMFVVVYVSTLIDVGHTIEPIYHSIVGGVPYKDFSVLTIIRFLVLNLVFIYSFSVSTNFREDAYRYLLFSRMKKRNTWYFTVMSYALFLSIVYWGIALITLMIYLFTLSLVTHEVNISYQLFFSMETMMYVLFNIFSSLSLLNFYLLLKYIVKKETIAFSSLTFFLLCYIFSYPLMGEGAFPIVTTTILSASRMNLELAGRNSLGINIFWQIIQNLFIGSFIVRYLNTYGME
ncbi:hypothetical protein D920_01098 [Enterococcus faecalis 13-SD-W-01]|nr:hypothetical protein D920_01098 [Enterococcus faecalis 13-SD-W-01]